MYDVIALYDSEIYIQDVSILYSEILYQEKIRNNLRYFESRDACDNFKLIIYEACIWNVLDDCEVHVSKSIKQ